MLSRRGVGMGSATNHFNSHRVHLDRGPPNNDESGWLPDDTHVREAGLVHLPCHLHVGTGAAELNSARHRSWV